MPMQTVTEKPVTYTAFKFNGTQADVDALNVYLTGSGWLASFINANTWHIAGPRGVRDLSTNEVVVFQKDAGNIVTAVAKFSGVADAQRRFTVV